MDANVPKLINKQLHYKGNYLSFFTKDFEITKPEIQKIITKKYEILEYKPKNLNQNCKKDSNICAISIIPIIKSKPKKIIIISVFRYTINKYSLEFPTNYINKQENENIDKLIEESANSEIEEKTGYKGKFKCVLSKFFGEKNIKMDNNVFFDPWKSTDNAIECVVEINEENLKNKDKNKNKTEKVFEIEIEKLLDFITEKINKEQYACSVELYNFAFGINFNKYLNKI